MPWWSAELNLISHTRQIGAHFFFQDRLFFSAVRIPKTTNLALIKVQALLPFHNWLMIFFDHFLDFWLVPRLIEGNLPGWQLLDDNSSANLHNG